MSIARLRNTQLGGFVATAMAMFALAGCCEPHRSASKRTINVAAGVTCPSGDDANDMLARRQSAEWGQVEGEGTPRSLSVSIEQCCYLTRVIGPVAHWSPLCYESPDGAECVSADLAPSELGSNYGYAITDILGAPWRGADLVVGCSYDVTEYDWADICG